MKGRPLFVQDKQPKEEDNLAYRRLYHLVKHQGYPNRGPIVAELLSNPEDFGVKGILRQELLNMLWRSLTRYGFVGQQEDFTLESHLNRAVRMHEQDDEGGLL